MKSLHIVLSDNQSVVAVFNKARSDINCDDSDYVSVWEDIILEPVPWWIIQLV